MKKAPKKKAPKRKLTTYAFVDTNIFLDFYKGNSEATLSLLEKLESVKNRIICTYQVEMEFLKNRQNQINRIISDAKIDLDVRLPAVLSDTQIENSLKSTKKELEKKKIVLRARIQKLLKSPSKNDRVFQVLESIFHNESSHVLKREMKIRHQVKRKAWRRFMLGYPPRKSADTSIGDALNWEWFVHCAQSLKGRFIIISNDGDFGCEQAGDYYLNDQLRQEFVDRVGQKPLIFTKRLSEGLKEMHVSVTKKEEDAEKHITGSGGVLPRVRQSMTARNFGQSLLIDRSMAETYQSALSRALRDVDRGSLSHAIRELDQGGIRSLLREIERNQIGNTDLDND